MLTPEGCKQRRRRLWDRLPEKPDWILISDPQHLMYFANYFQSPFVFRSNDAGAVLILGPAGESILVADSMVQVFLDQAHVGEVAAPVWYNGKRSAPHREGLLAHSVLDRLRSCPGTNFGIESAILPTTIRDGLAASRPGARFLPVDEVIRELKRAKDPDELMLMKRSVAAGEAGFAAALREIKPGMSELDAYLIVQNASLEALGEQAVVYGDFVSGPRCETGGGPPGSRRIEPNDLYLLDFSVVVYGYRADFANTFVVQGRADEERRRLYHACLDAMAAGETLLRAGALCRDVDRAVRDSLDAKHLGEYFRSHTGHGLGLGHPDPPYIVPESTDRLEIGDVVTLEPSQLVPGVAGMRFERNYLITDAGFELLTHHELKIDAQ